MIRPLRCALLVLCACVSSAALPAAAQPKRPGVTGKDPKLVEAKRLFDQGATLYTQGSYEAAIEAWHLAYDLSKRPLIFQNIANAYERLGNPRKAREFLLQWRAAAPLDELDVVDARVKNMDARIARENDLEVARKAEQARLAAAAAAKKAVPPPPLAGPPPDTGIYVPGVLVAGTGVVAVGVGVALDAVAASKRSSARAGCTTTSGGTLCLASSRDAILSSNALAVVGDAFWIAGSVLAAGGAALVLTHQPASAQDATPPQVTVAPTALSGGGGLVLSGRF